MFQPDRQLVLIHRDPYRGSMATANVIPITFFMYCPYIALLSELAGVGSKKVREYFSWKKS